MSSTNPSFPRMRLRAGLQSVREAGGRVWLLIAALWALTAVAGTIAASHGVGERVTLLPLLLIPTFVVVESFPVHLQFRSESTSYSLLEIPIVVGLFLTDGWILIGCVGIGAFIALAVVRRQPLVKLAFNLANLMAQASVTIMVFGALTPGPNPIDPHVGASALTAAIVGSILSVTSIALIIRASEGEISLGKYANTVLLAIIVGVANASLGLISVELFNSSPWSLSLLLIPLSVLLASYRAFVSEKSQREQVEFLYSATKSLHTVDEDETGVARLVREAASMFRANRVDLLLFPGADDPRAHHYVFDALAGSSITTADEVPDAAEQVARGEADVQLVTLSDSGLARTYLDGEGIREGMVASLRTQDKVIGLLTIADRVGTAANFGAEDLRLFETLAFHVATALENDRLGQALTQLRRLEQELSHLATHDALTGLPNRLALRQHLDRVTTEGRRDIELLFIDLDDFKLVNDTFGHGAGDDLLHEVAIRIQSCTRGSDTAARLGGDEFAVVVQPAGSGAAIAERIIDAVSAPINVAGNFVTVGCSVGIAAPDPGEPTSHLLRHADVAMYAAKNAGKRRIAHYSPELGEELAATQQLQQRIRDGMDRGEFRVHYQPIHDIAQGRMVGSEALVRWNVGDDLREAEAFLSIAEESGFITEIDRWVMRQVLEDLSALGPDGDDLWTSVNLSVRNLQEDDIVDFIISSVREAGVRPERVVLEITETAAMRDIESNIAKLERLAAVGFSIALDDFGTGFSSISHLRRLPVDLLKIAQPFVADLGGAGGEQFVKAIVELGHAMNLRIVGEGVELPEQLAGLHHLGCDLAQGYLMARPMPFEELCTAFMRQSADEFTGAARQALELS